MTEYPQFAYTGASPEKGYVGFINIQERDSGVRFSVRSEGENPPQAEFTVPKAEAVAMLSSALVALGGPAKHDFWMAGEADCPREVKAGNGELHTLRCKRCGQDNPRSQICVPA